MAQKRNKRVYAGFYGTPDGKLIYVVMVVKDINTGEDIVICQEHKHTGNSDYFAISKASFCEQILLNGEYVDKYSRKTQYKVESFEISNLRKDELPTPRRKKEPIDEYSYRYRRISPNYYAYAKDLCENYLIDLRTYNLCIQEKQYIGLFSKKDFDVLKEDLLYLKECRKTILREFDGYFKERFYEGKSIWKYAEEHNLNRGSVDYLQKKFFTALGKALHDRDLADKKKRIREPKNKG